MDYIKDQTKPEYRSRYLGWKRHGLFHLRSARPTWVIERYIECWSAYPEADSTWCYREVGRYFSEVSVEVDLRRFRANDTM